MLDLENAYTNTYRQDSFNESVIKTVVIGRGNTKVLMAQETASLIGTLRQQAKAAGFKEGMPVLDLSSQGVGLIYLIGGQKFPVAWSPAGTPWAE